jgi:hypothetical protein
MHIRLLHITITAADLTLYKPMRMHSSITAVLYLPQYKTTIFFAPSRTWQMRLHLITTQKSENVLYKYFLEKCKLWSGIILIILNAGLTYIQSGTAILGAQLTSVSHLKYVLVMCQLWDFIVFVLNYGEIQHKVCFWELRQKDNMLRQMCLCISVA